MIGKKIIYKEILAFCIFVTAILSYGVNIYGNEPQFILDIDALILSKGESTQLVLSMINAQDGQILSIEGLEDFNVISTSTSTSTQIINRDVTHKKSHTYVIMPKTTGEFSLIGSVQFNGNTYQTNELRISVTEATTTTEEGEAKDLFIKTILSENEIYFGQKAVLTYELYSRYNIQNFGFLDSTDLDGFISQDIRQDVFNPEYLYIDGKKYVKYVVLQAFLSPIKTGLYQIPQYNFQVNVSTGNFFDSSRPFYLQTQPKELKVNPLPLDNRPNNFSGLAGTLNVDSNYTRQEIDIKDSLTLEVTLYGNCNLESLRKIIQKDIPGFSVYETEKNTQESIEDNKYNVRKEYEIILIPEKTGQIKIDPISIPYFNTETLSYDRIEIPGTTVKVTGEMTQVQGNIAAPSSTQIERVNIDQISYASGNDSYLTITLKKSTLYIVLPLILIIMIIIAAIFKIPLFLSKTDKNLALLYNKIKKSNDQNDIYNTFNDMLKYCFDLSIKASPRSVINEKLAPYGILVPVLEIMDYMENRKDSSFPLKDKINDIYAVLKKLKRAY
ncbi:UNVERIFIED_CONTAM: oxygen tolerance protein BatD [Acetivibrio alkalicellulosi]